MEKTLWLIGTFVVISVFFYSALSVISKRRYVQQRINQYFVSTSLEEREESDTGNRSLEKMSQMIGKAFNGVQFSQKTKSLLVEAGSGMTPEQLFAYRLMSGTSLSILMLILQAHWIFALTGLTLGFLLPGWIMANKRRKRLSALPLQLIDALGMMANSMRAGFSFMQVMQLVGKEMPSPIGPEFERAVRQVGLGEPLEEVFEEMISRLPNKELEVVLEAIIAQRKSGGNLAELLETMEDTIRGRVRIMGELQTLTSQGKLSSLIITLLPVGLGLYLYIVDPAYFAPLIEHPIGIAMLILSCFLVLIGWFAIRKILRIEV